MKKNENKDKKTNKRKNKGGKWLPWTIAVLTAVTIAVSACTTTGVDNAATGTDNATVTRQQNATGGIVTESEIASAAAEVSETLSAVSAEDYLLTEVIAVSEAQAEDEIPEDATCIDLSALTADNAPAGTSFKDSVLTVEAAGVYVLTGELNGAVEVAKNVEGVVRIVLNGVTIKTTATQTVAAITFKQADDLRILTVAAGTTNEVSDSAGDTAAEGEGAAIQAKKCSLTINGTGTLNVTAIGDEAGGIKVKKSLTMLDTTISVFAVKNGVKADDSIVMKNASLAVTAGGDAIKTDVEPETDEEATAYAADRTAGYIYIEHTSLTLSAADDGLVANGCLYIANDDADVITITTNGGAPDQITERSSDAADGKAIKVAGVTLTDEEDDETDYPAAYTENYALVVTGGTFRVDSNDDALHSKGNLLITGGTFTIASGDDGVHAEYLTKITGGTIDITRCYEGVEGAAVEITGGTVRITAKDDGVNAANADLTGYACYILVTGGDVTVDCSGDGLDSNGKLLLAGGKLTVFGPATGGNSALDSETGTTISGGTVISTCFESMDPVGSTQYRVEANVNVSAGTTVTLRDADGVEVVGFVATKTCRNVLISTSTMTAGTYTLTYGTQSVTLTATAGTANGRGGFGGMGGNFDGRGGHPPMDGQGGQRPDGQGGQRGQGGQPPQNGQDGSTPPELPDGQSFDGTTPPNGQTPPNAADGNQNATSPAQMG